MFANPVAVRFPSLTLGYVAFAQSITVVGSATTPSKNVHVSVDALRAIPVWYYVPLL